MRGYRQPSFAERYRTLIVGVVAVAAVVVVGVFVFTSANRPTYACTTLFQPSPTPSPVAGASAQPGYLEEDMGRGHVAVGDQVKYTFCPPASGNHYNASGFGPILPRLYGPNDKTLPEGWVHNLEHGGLVVLYRGDGPGASADGQKALRDLFTSFPASPVCGFAAGTNYSPVIARFDDMATPYAALVWGRVLPLETLDTQAILAFNSAWAEKTNPEAFCSPAPTGSPSPGTSGSASPAPSSSAAPSASAS